MFTLKLAALLGMIPIAKVCQVCCPVQGSGLGVVTKPSSSTSPSQHSGDAVHRAPAPATDAAGHWVVVVATSNVSIALLVAPVVPVALVVPVAPVALLVAPVLAGVLAGASRRSPTIRPAAPTRTRPPPTAAASAARRQRRRWVTGLAAWPGGVVPARLRDMAAGGCVACRGGAV